MEYGKHTKFILTPIFDILEDCVNATKGIGKGVENYPLYDYIMQTTFLKMTGASEQKLKCILWEIATDDFDFRYDFLKSSYGECSKLEDKNKVFKVLKEQIIHLNLCDECLKNVFTDNIKLQIQKKATQNIIDLLQQTVLVSWQEKQFLFFKTNSSSYLDINQYCNFSIDGGKNQKLSLLEKSIDYDKLVWKQRNRCAHNLKSYQVNLPSLSAIRDKNYDYENYFFRFSILILLDEIFMKIYSEYLELLENNI